MESASYKIVLLGDSTVGKTSILNRYINGTFAEQQDRTLNAHCAKKIISINNDTAGQEEFHALAPLYYRDAQGAVLVFDMSKRDTFERCEKWFDELSSYGEGKKVIICGNKSDKEELQVTVKEAKKLAGKYNSQFLLTSARNDVNINEIFYNLAIEIYHEHLKKENEILQRKRKTIKVTESNVLEDNKKCC